MVIQGLKPDVAKIASICALTLCLSADMSSIAYADTLVDIGAGAIATTDGGTYYVTGETVESSLNNISCVGGNITIILDNVDMDLSDWVEAISINSGANVSLVLKGENKITSGWGIIVTYGSTLNISGEGSLDVHARNSSAIGNINYDSRGMGNINIQSGALELTSENGCGIGVAVSDDGINKIGDIVISGGNVKATGSSECAGIGSVNSSSLGNVYIGGDSVVEASSVYGAGIGTGADQSSSEVERELGDIVITDEASVNAVSYGGAGIGTGDNQDKTTKVTIDKSASVKAESNLANAVGDGASSNISSAVSISDGAEVELFSYKGDALPVGANTNIVELKLDTAPSEEIAVSSLEIPAGCYSVATSKMDSLEDRVVVHEETVEEGKVTKRISIKAEKEHNIVYVSDTGSDYSSGKTLATPVKSFEKAYRLVENGGTIIASKGAIEINRVPRLGKKVTVSSLGDAKIKFNTDRVNVHDSLLVSGAKCELTGRNELDSKVTFKNTVLTKRKAGILNKSFLKRKGYNSMYIV